MMTNDVGGALTRVEARQEEKVAGGGGSKGSGVGFFRKKPVEIKAAQWFRNGDHPDDYEMSQFGMEKGQPKTFTGEERKANGWEGGVVRYFRRPDVDGRRGCRHCNHTMHDHGWIDTLEGGHIVCPGDWIITGVNGEHYPCKPDIFAQTYEPVAQATAPAQGNANAASDPASPPSAA